MPEPAEYLLATLHGCEEFWDVFRTGIYALAPAVVDEANIPDVPSNRYQHPDYSFIRASVKWTTVFREFSGYSTEFQTNTYYNEAHPAAIALYGSGRDDPV